MPLVTANQFQLGRDFSQLGRGFAQGAQLANQFNIGEQRREEAARAGTQFEQEQSIQRAGILNQSARALKSLPIDQRQAALQQLTPRLAEFNIDASVFQGADLSDIELDQAIASTQGLLADPQAATKLGLQKRTLDIREKELGQRRELKELEPELAGRKEEKKLEAQLGLKPTLEGKIEKAKTDVKAAADVVSKSFEKIGNITTNVRNIDRAIAAIDRGAKTGVIAKLAPSITSASRELKQIQNELGLDIIGSVTFGALSQGELDLALDTALDTGQDPAALKDILIRKKEAQNKLINYLDEQIQFLDDGGTLAGWREQLQQAPSTDLTQLSDEDLLQQLEAARGGQ
jgi:hypothetical protein